MPAPDDRERRAPEGTACAKHPGRVAHFDCPHCNAHVCFVCWHPAVRRCQVCLDRDPTEAAPPIPWERPELSFARRYFATLATAFSPARSAPAFARNEVEPALRFFLLSALPFALLAGVIPHTRTLSFEGSFAVHLVGSPSPIHIALDVAMAMALQAVLSGLELACLFLPFASLVRAYAPKERHAAALRVLYYRGWLISAAPLLFVLAIWALPAAAPSTLSGDTAPVGFALASLLRVMIPVLLFIAMSSTARLACGLGPLLSMVVVLVPILLWLLVEGLASTGLAHLLPMAAGAVHPTSGP